MKSRKKVSSWSGVFIFSPFSGFAAERISAAMQRQREAGGEEQGHRQHVRRIVVEMQVLVAGVRHPIEVAEDAVGEAVAPGAEQQRAEHHQRDIGEDREAEGDRHVIADAELAADLDLAQRPGNEGRERADGDDLPEPALPERREGEAVGKVGGRDVDEPGIERLPASRRPRRSGWCRATRRTAS